MAETVLSRPGLPTAAEILAPSPGTLLRRRVFRHWGLLAGVLILTVILAMALLAPVLAPFDPFDQQLDRKLIPPIWHASTKATWVHVFGTDQLGRDYLSRLLYGAQISLLIGVSAMLISGFIGTTLGVLAGYFGGRVDMVVSFIISTRLSLPVVLVALAVVAIIGTSLNVVILGAGTADLGPLCLGHAQCHIAGAHGNSSRRHRPPWGASTPCTLFTEVVPNVLNHLM